MAALAARLQGRERVAVWASLRLETAIAVLGAIRAGVAAVPVNPGSGERELEHLAADSAPSLVLCSAGEPLPVQLAGVERPRGRRRRAAVTCSRLSPTRTLPR